MKFIIDATNKKVGRIASEAAKLLIGKHLSSFAKNKVANVEVEIANAGKADVSSKKKETKQYTSFSGHAGGIRYISMKRLIEMKGFSEVIRRAVYGMLPTNKLRALMMKNLDIKE